MTATPRSTLRSSPTPTARRRRWSPQLRAAGRAGRRPERRLPAPRRRRLRAVVPPAPRSRSCSREAVYGLPERYREQIAGADLVANPGCYPTATRAGARAAGARGPDRRRRDRRQVRRLGRRARSDRRDAFRDRRRERQRLRRPAPPPHARDRAGAGRARRRADGHVHAPPAAAGPGRACLLLRDARPGRRTRTTSMRSTSELYAGEPFVELADSPPGVRDVRETNICRISVHRRRAHRHA